MRSKHAKSYRRYIWRLISEMYVKPGTPWKWILPISDPYQSYFGDCWCGCGRRCMWRCWQCNDFFTAHICGVREAEWNPCTAYHDAWYQRCERCVPEEDYCLCGCNQFADGYVQNVATVSLATVVSLGIVGILLSKRPTSIFLPRRNVGSR